MTAADIVRQFEGCSLTAYRCPAGIWTIGFGHTDGVVRGMKITQHQAEVMLQYDLENAQEIVEGAVRRRLEPHQLAALVSFVFNVGPGKKGLRDGFVVTKTGRPSLMLTLLNVGNLQGAADQFTRWVRGGGKILPGLVKRRALERSVFLGEA